ncbi:hypothetical protein LCGC14_2166850, partial [marine sediment metagenome]
MEEELDASGTYQLRAAELIDTVFDGNYTRPARDDTIYEMVYSPAGGSVVMFSLAPDYEQWPWRGQPLRGDLLREGLERLSSDPTQPAFDVEPLTYMSTPIPGQRWPLLGMLAAGDVKDPQTNEPIDVVALAKTAWDAYLHQAGIGEWLNFVDLETTWKLTSMIQLVGAGDVKGYSLDGDAYIEAPAGVELVTNTTLDAVVAKYLISALVGMMHNSRPEDWDNHDGEVVQEAGNRAGVVVPQQIAEDIDDSVTQEQWRAIAAYLEGETTGGRSQMGHWETTTPISCLTGEPMAPVRIYIKSPSELEADRQAEARAAAIQSAAQRVLGGNLDRISITSANAALSDTPGATHKYYLHARCPTAAMAIPFSTNDGSRYLAILKFFSPGWFSGGYYKLEGIIFGGSDPDLAMEELVLAPHREAYGQHTETWLDRITAFTPLFNDGRDVIEMLTGHDMITGELLTFDEWKATTFMMVVPGGSGREVRMADDGWDAVRRGAPVLGICLGTQIILDESEENGETKCLGIVPGKVQRFP